MFDPQEVGRIRAAITARTKADSKLLDALRLQIRNLKSSVRVIKPRSVTSISLVASDGGNNAVDFNPFHITVVRIVDSYGQQLLTDVVSSGTDPEELGRAQFRPDGSPETALGVMMRDLGVDTLWELSPMIPSPADIAKNPDNISTGWVLVFRDLAEWAVLYDLICHKEFGGHTLLVRDGLLRSKIFKKDLFIKLGQLINKAIDFQLKTRKRNIFLVGVAKHSNVIDKYNLAIATENLFPSGEAYYVRIPRDIEASAYRWPEYARGPEDAEGGGTGTAGEAPKYVAGSLYLVRFGPKSGDPIWPVDILTTQAGKDSEIFGYLLADAIDGFPVPHYPRCLQKAHEHAQLGGFDFDLLQEGIYDAVRDVLPTERRTVVDEIRLRSDVSSRRYQ